MSVDSLEAIPPANTRELNLYSVSVCIAPGSALYLPGNFLLQLYKVDNSGLYAAELTLLQENSKPSHPDPLIFIVCNCQFLFHPDFIPVSEYLTESSSVTASLHPLTSSLWPFIIIA